MKARTINRLIRGYRWASYLFLILAGLSLGNYFTSGWQWPFLLGTILFVTLGVTCMIFEMRYIARRRAGW